MTIVKTENGSTTHIRTKGFEVRQPGLINKISEKLRDNVARHDIVIFSGSLPPGIAETTYSDLIALCNQIGACVILDTSGVRFLNAISSKPFLVKPNLAELLSTFGPNSLKDDEASIMNQMSELARKGITFVAVSLGSKGVLVLDAITSSFIRGNVSLGTEYAFWKAVGSGDAMLAGFAFALKNRSGVHEMVRLGVACGAANTVSRLMDTNDLDRIKSFQDQARIEIVRKIPPG